MDNKSIGFILTLLPGLWMNVSLGKDIPTTEEFQGLLMGCAIGANIEVSADLLGSITTIYEGDKTQGLATIKSEAKFLDLIPENDRLRAYELYTTCILKMLRADDPKEEACITLPYRCYSNLLGCSNPIPVYVLNQSASTAEMVDSRLEVEFSNQSNGSGIAFQFKPNLDLNNLSSLELNGFSLNAFQFRVEYKVRKGKQLQIVGESAPRTFPATTVAQSVRVPLTTNACIDEIVINFYRLEDRSKLVLNYLAVR